MGKTVRVVSMQPEFLIKWVDDYADKMGLSRTTVITLALKSFVDQQEVIEMSRIARKLEVEGQMQQLSSDSKQGEV